MAEVRVLALAGGVLGADLLDVLDAAPGGRVVGVLVSHAPGGERVPCPFTMRWAERRGIPWRYVPTWRDADHAALGLPDADLAYSLAYDLVLPARVLARDGAARGEPAPRNRPGLPRRVLHDVGARARRARARRDAARDDAGGGRGRDPRAAHAPGDARDDGRGGDPRGRGAGGRAVPGDAGRPARRPPRRASAAAGGRDVRPRPARPRAHRDRVPRPERARAGAVEPAVPEPARDARRAPARVVGRAAGAPSRRAGGAGAGGGPARRQPARA